VVSACFNLNELMQLNTDARNLGSMSKPINTGAKAKDVQEEQSLPKTAKAVQWELFRSRDFH